jgi:hypothetical protein
MDAVCVKCGEELRRAGVMHRAELRATRHLLGLRGKRRTPLSQTSFAKLVGISVRALGAYERGERKIPATVAKEVRRLKEEYGPLAAAGPK